MAGWIDRILRRREQRRYSAPYPLPGGSIAGMLSDYGAAIPAVRAHSVAAAASCISLIANCISAVPARIVLDSGEEAPQSAPAWRILRRPCATLSFKAYLNTTTRSLLETGNSLSLIVRDDRSAPRGLVPIPWGWVTPRVLAPGEIGFDITNKSAEAALLGIPARLMREDAVHIVWASDDAITGRGPLQRSGAVFREA
jgi:phage portal protein BeeE